MQSIINKHVAIFPGVNVYLERRISKPLDTRLRRGRDRQTDRDRDRHIERQRETENSISNSKTLILKDSSIRLIWTASPCYTAKTEREREGGGGRERGGGGRKREAVTRLTKQKTTAPCKTEERTRRWKTRPVHNLQKLRLYNGESRG